MKKELLQYEKKNKYLLCVDSDGTAMNTMDIKHNECFGPAFIETWGLEAHAEEVQHIWNVINLASVKRGINRFLGLQLTLEYVSKYVTPIEGLDELKQWIDTTPALSNVELIRYLEDVDSPILEKALSWSQHASLNIALYPIEGRRPFDGVAESLIYAREESDIVVVSGANPDAMDEEWEANGLAYFVDLILNQNIGTKEYCISELIKKGYDPRNVIMVGDAMEDLDVAKRCGICFYPIIITKEVDSWARFQDEAIDRFYDGTYAGDYEAALIKEFKDALCGKFE